MSTSRSFQAPSADLSATAIAMDVAADRAARDDAVTRGLYQPTHEHDACGVGFVVDMKGRRSHDLVQQALQILLNLQHRGACGCEKNTGDGAGILIQMPDRFLRQEAHQLGVRLPAHGEYAVGMVFLPTDANDRRRCEGIFESVIRAEDQHLLGWRVVPFSMKHAENLPTPWAEYFIDDLEAHGNYTLGQKLARVPKVIYSLEARRRLPGMRPDMKSWMAGRVRGPPKERRSRP